MKAEILMDPASRAGVLRISPETSIEAYALNQWGSNFHQGDQASILCWQTEIPDLSKESD